jgi:hypothetical protein
VYSIQRTVKRIFEILSTYIYYFYSHPKAILNDKKKIANRMRHSYDTAAVNYIKLNIDPEMQPQIEGTVIKVPVGPMAPLVQNST